MDADLHSRLLAAVEEQKRVALAPYEGEPGAWRLGPPNMRHGTQNIVDAAGDALAEVGTVMDARFIVAWNPAVALRWLGYAEKVLARHKPRELSDIEMVVCDCCGWDLDADGEGEPTDHCPSIRDLAEVLGVPIEEETRD